MATLRAMIYFLFLAAILIDLQAGDLALATDDFLNLVIVGLTIEIAWLIRQTIHYWIGVYFRGKGENNDDCQ